MRGLSASTSYPSLHAPPGEERAPTLRFYWELVRGRSTHRIEPIAFLLQPGLRPALAALRQCTHAALRVSVLVELHERTAVEPCWRAAETLHAWGIGLDVWVHLADDDVRFLNTKTAARFQELLLPFLDRLQKDTYGRQVGVSLDIEPGLDTLEAAWRVTNGASLLDKAKGIGNVARGLWSHALSARQGHRDLKELASDLAARNVEVHAAVMPPLLPSHLPGREAVQHWLLGCPVLGEEGAPLFPRQAALCYAPLLARAGLGRAAQHETFSLWAARHRQSFDAVVVGLLSTGLLHDEPVYADPAHLRQDLAAARALGFTDIGVYSLEGLLFGPAGDPVDVEKPQLRDDLGAWLAALAVV